MKFDTKMMTTKPVTCKQCGRELKGLSALGGHMRSAHKKQKASKPMLAPPTEPVQASRQPVTQQALEPKVKAEQIRELLAQGGA